MANRYCKQCGKPLQAGKRFCGGCGSAVPANAVAAGSAPTAPPEADSKCAHCHARLIPGKRFCNQCGYAVASATLDVPNNAKSVEPQSPTPEVIQKVAPVSSLAIAESETPAQLSGLTCANCDAAIAAGKAFCKKCGHAVIGSLLPEARIETLRVEAPEEAIDSEPIESLVSTEQASTGAPPALACVNCGTTIAVGKPFCKNCGSAVSATPRPPELSPAQPIAIGPLVPAALHENSAAPDNNPVPVTDSKSQPLPTEETAQLQEINPPSTANFQQEEGYLGEESAPFNSVIAESDSQPLDATLATGAADASTLPGDFETPTVEPVDEARPITPPYIPPFPSTLESPIAAPRKPLAAIVAIAFVVLATAAAGISWYVFHHAQIRRDQPQTATVKNPDSTTGTKPSAGTPMTQTAVPPPAPKPASAQSSGTNQAEKAATQTSPSVKMPTPAPQPAHTSRPVSNPTPSIVNAPTPEFAHTRSLMSPRKGVLQYAGPPVPFGGIVVFGNLPKDRLRFTFDRGAWQPLIHKNPDGTQTLTLRSIKQGVQTSCEVTWEISE